MHPVLYGLGLFDALQREGCSVSCQSDVPAFDDPSDVEAGGCRPETHHPIQVRAVQGELDPHTLILAPWGQALSL